MNDLKFSVIIPVYDRPQEMGELLQSLALQTYTDFEIIIVEDGSQLDCKKEIKEYADKLRIRYFFKKNSGPGHSRNFGMSKATGDYLIFFDSDCLIPGKYFENVVAHLSEYPLDAYGGPDRAHEDFSQVQKAINYAMTSFITTGGIRGRKRQLDTFQPRSFNMGLSQQVFDKVGGFSELHPGEDPDLSYRIQEAGFTTGLIAEAYVYHKRRINFKQFRTQVYKFGLARSILMKWHARSKRWVYALPSLALITGLVLFTGGFYLQVLWWPLILGLAVLFLDALRSTGNLWIALQGVLASLVQIAGYGWGFMKGFWQLQILGKEERRQFPGMFFDTDPKERNLPT